ncbi:MAG: lamin tail domain-containing protein, partial [Chloroflexi bacterium]|nr:lamin tail domain-containing protein [Chloroflexota bacterium]
MPLTACRRRIRRLAYASIAALCLVALLLPGPDRFPVRAATANPLVISEIQIGGAAAGDEFVELYNPTHSAVSLASWKLTRKNSSGVEGNLVSSAGFSGSIPAHGFFLITPQTGYTGSVSADLKYSQTSNTVAASYTVLLYDNTGALVGKAGFGAAVDFEGAPFASSPANNGSIERKPGAADSTGGNGVGFDAFPGAGTISDTDEWIELRNTGSAAVKLQTGSGWTLTITDSGTDV